MAIKVEVDTTKGKFPKLMQNDMYLMLFHSKGKGTVLQVVGDAAAWCIGESRLDIPMNNYVDHHGTIRLTNR